MLARHRFTNVSADAVVGLEAYQGGKVIGVFCYSLLKVEFYTTLYYRVPQEEAIKTPKTRLDVLPWSLG